MGKNTKKPVQAEVKTHLDRDPNDPRVKSKELREQAKELRKEEKGKEV